MELMDMDYVGTGYVGVEVLATSAGTTMSSAASATEGEGAAVTATATVSEDEGDLRRGPWTEEEDSLLVDYISKHGEGRWNSLARCAGLRHTGKSCRLRWLNYLRPDVRRGNITPEEQLLILELHSRWGNRWSKIAQRLPGRTDNEIKNYWRTRVQKHARQLRCDVNSAQFRDVVRLVWMPRLVERMQAAAADSTSCSASAAAGVEEVTATTGRAMICSSPAAADSGAATRRYCGYVDVDVAPEGSAGGHRRRRRRVDQYASISEPAGRVVAPTMSPDTSSTLRSSASTVPPSHGTHFTPWAGAAAAAMTNVDGTVMQRAGGDQGQLMGVDHVTNGGDEFSGSWSELLAATGLPDFEFGDFDDNLWSLEDVYLQQHCQ